MSEFPHRDLAVVRDLARRTYDLAVSEEMEVRRRRWREVNGLRRPDRAPVWWQAHAAWLQILPESALQCTDETCRALECQLRQDLYQWECGADHVWEPAYRVPAHWESDPAHPFGIPLGAQVASTEVGGFRYEHPLETLEDYDRLTVPQWRLNLVKSEEAASRMADLLGEARPVELAVGPPLGLTLCYYLENLRGMARMLEDLAFHPERVHRAMAKITEACLAGLRAADQTGRLTPNNTGPMFCSDPLGQPAADGTLRLCNLWAGANSQEFQAVSPRMFEEFLLNYQIPLFSQFGATQYGCCEDLSHKIDAVLRVPNLRVFVSSYWTDLDKVLEATGGRYCIMWRQSAAKVVFPDDLEPIRRHLEEGMRKLQGFPYQVVLRELETLHGHLDRLREWTRLAVEVAERWA